MNLELSQDRERALTVPCPLTACAAPVGQPCISFVTGKPLENLPAHNDRLVAAGVMHAPLDSRELRADPDSTKGMRW